MNSTEQILEELHMDTLDIQADIWENEHKWFEMQPDGIIEIVTNKKLLPEAEINFIEEEEELFMDL